MAAAAREIAVVIDARARDIGGFAVRRVLPFVRQRRVGPFTFLDHMGEAQFGPGQGVDVIAHPHIGLATVTYLLEGALMHRDSLGSEQRIRPGDINWMTAGRGIVHSERTPAPERQAGSRLHGLQLWVALPVELEEAAPSFQHHPAASLPELGSGGVQLKVLAGSAFGLTSPVQTASALFYADALMSPGSELRLPDEHEERAVYVVSGAIHCAAERATAGRMLVFVPGTAPALRAEAASRVVLLGGAPLPGERYMDWNFVSSSKQRIEQAKLDWREGRFPKVPGESEFVPLPAERSR